MLNECEYPTCSERVKRKQSRFCSLSCSSKNHAITGVMKSPPVYKTCPECKKEFTGKNVRRQVFCSHSCAAKSSNRKSPKRAKNTENVLDSECDWCFTPTKSNTNRGYCGIDCLRKGLAYLWLSGKEDGGTKHDVRSFVRKYIYARSGGRCEGIDSRTGRRCVEDRIVQLDHIDGDYENNDVDNLRHLCPTCHALTPTYGSRNRGNGRAWKRTYSNYSLKDRSMLDSIETMVYT